MGKDTRKRGYNSAADLPEEIRRLNADKLDELERLAPPVRATAEKKPNNSASSWRVSDTESRMTKTEAAFLEWLNSTTESPVYYEGITLKLGERRRYTPDFVVIDMVTGKVTCYEVKNSRNPSTGVTREKLLGAAREFKGIDFVLAVGTWNGAHYEWHQQPVSKH